MPEFDAIAASESLPGAERLAVDAIRSVRMGRGKRPLRSFHPSRSLSVGMASSPKCYAVTSIVSLSLCARLRRLPSQRPLRWSPAAGFLIQSVFDAPGAAIAHTRAWQSTGLNARVLRKAER